MDRDWPKYNEELVKRGTFFLDLSVVENWKAELKEMNAKKRGGQYKFPNSYMDFLCMFKPWMDYRTIEGLARQLTALGLVPAYPDYTTIWYRLHDKIPEISIDEVSEVEIASDGTGIKTSNAGEYRFDKYGKKGRKMKKYIVVVVTVDVKRKKILGVDAHIEGEGLSESEIAEEHMRKIKSKGIRITKFYGDGRYDTNSMFRCLDELGIKECAIKIRKNASTSGCRGSKRRRKEVREFKSKDYTTWSKSKGYGMRWPATEGTFSAVKRKFGENTRSRKPESLRAEAIQKFWVYSVLRSHGLKK